MNNRATDTVSRKVANWAVTLSCALVSFIYITDRANTSKYMDSIAGDVKTIAQKGISNSQDIHILKIAVGSLQEEAIKNSDFRTETRLYWAAKGHGNAK